MEKHISLAAVLNIAYGALGILCTVMIFVVISQGWFLLGDLEVMAFVTIIATAIGVLVVIMSALAIAGGIGLLRKQAWARILMLIVSVISLLNIPIGTIIGVYTIWVLMQDETLRLLTSGSKL